MEESPGDGEALFYCPSFNSYSSGRFAEIAAKVAEECGIDDAELCADERPPAETSNDIDDDDDDFEFALVRGADGDVTAEEILCGGQVRQVFPIFNRDLLAHDDQVRDATTDADASTLRIPLKQLFMEDRQGRDPHSSSSSEADELESIPPGTYCVWRPKEVEASPGRCKKSNSTGSASPSKRWKFRDLIRRSNSEGKDAFVFLTPKSTEAENSKQRRNSSDAVKGAGKAKAKGVAASGEKVPSSAHEVFYVRNRASKEGDKRKSFLPYRQDLVGLFANVNGMGKTFPF